MTKSFNTPAMQARRAQAGITLIEVSIGLIIAAIIAAAAFIAFQNNSRRSEVRENVVTITNTLAEVQQKFGRTNNYMGLNTVSAESSATIEEINSYNGAICVNGALAGEDTCTLPGTALTAPADNLPTNVAVVSWAAVPDDQCLDLVTATMGGAATVSAGTTAPGTVVATNGILAPGATCADGPNVITWVVPTR